MDDMRVFGCEFINDDFDDGDVLQRLRLDTAGALLRLALDRR